MWLYFKLSLTFSNRNTFSPIASSKFFHSIAQTMQKKKDVIQFQTQLNTKTMQDASPV